jgi:hypothetical protein
VSNFCIRGSVEFEKLNFNWWFLAILMKYGCVKSKKSFSLGRFSSGLCCLAVPAWGTFLKGL